MSRMCLFQAFKQCKPTCIYSVALNLIGDNKIFVLSPDHAVLKTLINVVKVNVNIRKSFFLIIILLITTTRTVRTLHDLW